VAYLGVEIDEHKVKILTKMSKILKEFLKILEGTFTHLESWNEKTFFGLGSKAWLPAFPAELAGLPSLVTIGACRHDVACCCLKYSAELAALGCLDEYAFPRAA
jgi:hypothetical protein